MEENYETIDLRELFNLVKNNLVLIITVTVLFAVAGFLGTSFLITPQYEASAIMIVNTRQDQTATVTNDQITSAKNLVSTYSIIVKSDTVLEPIISTLNLPLNYEKLKEKITVSAVDATQVMQVSAKDADPAMAKSIVSEIIKTAPDAITDMAEAGSVKVISEARVGDKPVSPNVNRNTALAALLGLVLSVGIVFLKEMMNNTFKTGDEITKVLGLAVIGVIPKVETKCY